MVTINQKYPSVDYGPLTLLIGTWNGDKGMDISPHPDMEKEENPFYETITIEEAGDLKNAKEQQISILRYLQIIRRKSNNEIFHDQTGYWMWDSQNEIVMQSLVIPRGLSLLAGGKVVANTVNKNVSLHVSASHDKPDWGIVQSPFLIEKAKTLSYEIILDVNGNTMKYKESTQLQIYGQAFDHTDENELVRA